MHIIECDGCKRQEVFVEGVTVDNANNTYPRGWASRNIFYRRPVGNGHAMQASALIHACSLDCVTTAALRSHGTYPGFTFGFGGSTTEWNGFRDVPAYKLDFLKTLPVEEGGHFKKEVKAKKSNKKPTITFHDDPAPVVGPPGGFVFQTIETATGAVNHWNANPAVQAAINAVADNMAALDDTQIAQIAAGLEGAAPLIATTWEPPTFTLAEDDTPE